MSVVGAPIGRAMGSTVEFYSVEAVSCSLLGVTQQWDHALSDA
jgi:hypothetical protein